MELNPIEKVYRRLLKQGKTPLKLFLGNPNQQGISFPTPTLQRAYHQFFQMQYYQPIPKGELEARKTIAEFYGQQGLNLNPENIILTSGSSESFAHLFRLLAKPGENFLAPNPCYPLFEHLADYSRIQLKYYQLDETQSWSIDLDSIQKATDGKTKGILLVSPHNPTGSVAQFHEIEWIIDWCRQKNLALICDEVFSEFYFKSNQFPRAVQMIDQLPLCFTLNGISKMFALPALKLGWILVSGPQSLVHQAVDQLETIADTFLSCHAGIQNALPEIFKEGQSFFPKYFEEVVDRKNMTIKLLREIPSIQFNEPQGGFYLMPKVVTDQFFNEESWVINLLREKNVFVHPGYFFDYEKGIHFVISFLTKPQILEEGIKKIGEFLK